MYPFTVLVAPLSDALPVAALREGQSTKLAWVPDNDTHTIDAANSA